MEQPRQEVIEPFGFVRGDLLKSILIVAHQDEEPFVNDGRVMELLVRVSRTQRRNRCIKHRRVAHACVKITRDERGRRGAERAGTQQ